MFPISAFPVRSKPPQPQSGARFASGIAGIFLLCLALTCLTPPVRAEGPLPLPATLLSLEQSDGQQRLRHSDYSQAYWPLADHFETQKNQAYCSVASSVVVLNALGVPRPETLLYPDYPYFTQLEFFQTVPDRLATAEGVSREGMTLAQLASVLGEFPVRVESHPADSLTLEQFRDLLKGNLGHTDRFLLLNFNRRIIGEAGGGHWSPLGAYDAASDSVLILDVARYKYPPVWVPVEAAYQAALSEDSVSRKSRGILLVGRP